MYWHHSGKASSLSIMSLWEKGRSLTTQLLQILSIVFIEILIKRFCTTNSAQQKKVELDPTDLFLRCWMLPRHLNLPFTIMPSLVHKASHSSMLQMTTGKELLSITMFERDGIVNNNRNSTVNVYVSQLVFQQNPHCM